MRVSTTDKIFSRTIREAYNHTCQRCGIVGQMDTAHFKSRRYTTGCLRWFPDNVLSLCRSCHWFVDSHPDEKVLLWRKHLGQPRLDDLRDRYNNGRRIPKKEHKAIQAHYRKELERILKLRAEGEVGPIEVISYE